MATQYKTIVVALQQSFEGLFCVISITLSHFALIHAGDEFGSDSWQTKAKEILGAKDRETPSDDWEGGSQNEEERFIKVRMPATPSTGSA